MVNEANECQLSDKANYIAFIARAFHITDKVGSIHPDFSKVIAQLTYISEDQQQRIIYDTKGQEDVCDTGSLLGTVVKPLAL